MARKRRTKSRGRSIFANHDNRKQSRQPGCAGNVMIANMKAWRSAIEKAIKEGGLFKFCNGDFIEGEKKDNK